MGPLNSEYFHRFWPPWFYAPRKRQKCDILTFSGARKIRGVKIDESIHCLVGPFVLFSYPEKIRGLSRKTREEIDFEKKNLQKFWFEIINISWNPKNHVFGPKMVIFGPRTPKFRILVTNYGTKDMFLDFLKNLQKWPFLSFGSIFGVFCENACRGAPGDPILL